MYYLPQSHFGKWSVFSLISMPLLFALGYKLLAIYEGVPSGSSIPQDVLVRPGVAIPMLASFVAGVAAGVFGYLALYTQRDRALLVYLSTGIGTLVVVFIIMEIAFPH